jgi:hypothetical protein
MRKRIAFEFCRAHGRRQRLVTSQRLGIDTTLAAGLASGRAPLNISRASRETIPA